MDNTAQHSIEPANVGRGDDLTIRFEVEATPDQVFAAINNPRAWWSGDFEGGSDRLGDVFTYRYKEFHYSKQEVTEFVPGTRVVWRVVEGMLSFVKDKQEWVGTTIEFDISARGTMTEVAFVHVGIRPHVECYSTCSEAWTSLIKGSLKRFIETGRVEQIELDAPAA